MTVIIVLYDNMFLYNNVLYNKKQIISKIYKNDKINIVRIVITDSDKYKVDNDILYLLCNKNTVIYSYTDIDLNETFEKVDKTFYKIRDGHHFRIEKAIFKLYILVPLRDNPGENYREKMLLKFRDYINKYLNNFGIDYTLVVCKQTDKGMFRRGALLNAGFLEIEKNSTDKKIPYYCHHNVDLFPLNNKVDYSYINGVRDIFGYAKGVGGICIFDGDNFKQSGGFPNDCLVWGGEDILLKERYKKIGIEMSRTSDYNNPEHVKEIGHPRDTSYNTSNIKKLLNNKTHLYNVKYNVINVSNNVITIDLE
jgi:hypothetical protein